MHISHNYLKIFGIIFLVNKILTQEILDMVAYGFEAFGYPDPESGKRLENWNPIDGGNAEEQGTYFEGDILFQTPLGKSGLKDIGKQWVGGIVPYVINGNFNQSNLAMIANAMNQFHNRTCIKFVKRTIQTDYILISNNRTGCFSAVGRIGGVQYVNLQIPGCLFKIGTVIHEFMHAIGFFHEHTRWDRDNFVTIAFENIMPGSIRNFNKVSQTVTDDYASKYNYGSVMHYSSKAFSKNNNATIIPKTVTAYMGQRYGFNQSDINMINVMYKCRPKTISTTTPRPLIPTKMSSISSNPDDLFDYFVNMFNNKS